MGETAILVFGLVMHKIVHGGGLPEKILTEGQKKRFIMAGRE